MLEKRNSAWRLTEPFDWPANIWTVQRLLDELRFVTAEAGFDAAEAKARRANDEVRLVVGHPHRIPGGLLVRVSGKSGSSVRCRLSSRCRVVFGEVRIDVGVGCPTAGGQSDEQLPAEVCVNVETGQARGAGAQRRDDIEVLIGGSHLAKGLQ